MTNFDRDRFVSRAAQDWSDERFRRAYASGRQDEHDHPVDGVVYSGAFAEAARDVGIGDFQAIYDRMAAGSTEAAVA